MLCLHRILRPLAGRVPWGGLPTEIWQQIGRSVVTADRLRFAWPDSPLTHLASLRLANKHVSQALCDVQREVRLSGFLRRDVQRVLSVEEELLETAYSTYFSVVCANSEPLVYFRGEIFSVISLSVILGVEDPNYDAGCGPPRLLEAEEKDLKDMYLLVTTHREEATGKLEIGEVKAACVEGLPLREATMRCIAETMIKQRHPWAEPERFDFFLDRLVGLPDGFQQQYDDLTFDDDVSLSEDEAHFVDDIIDDIIYYDVNA